MAIRVSLSKEDIASGKLVNPGWYHFTVTKIVEGRAKDGSNLITVSFRGNEGDAEDVPVMAWFSEKFMSPWVKFLGAFGIDVKPGEVYEVDSLQGQQLKLLINNEEYNNQMRNAVKDYLPKAA